MKLKLTYNRFLRIFLGFTLFFLACSKDKTISVDMITARSMGLAYLEENKLAEAEAVFKQLIEIAPDEPLGYANLALVYSRMPKYDLSETYFLKALQIAPKDPEIQFNLAEVLMLTNKADQAIQILDETLRYNPDHIKTLYKLGIIYSKSKDKLVKEKGENYLIKVVDFLPLNLTARLDLIDLLLQNDKTDLALNHMETLIKIMPDFPDEANEFYQTSLRYIKENNSKQAITPFNIFRNILKPTALFQAGFTELKGMSGPLIGTPVFTFSKDFIQSQQSSQMILDAIHFTDATAAAGLNTLPIIKSDSSAQQFSFYTLATADFDGNGTQDLYASIWDKQKKTATQYLFKNNFGKFIDIATDAGIKHSGEDKDAIFADYDNDGYLDLFLVNSKQNVLYYHSAPQKFLNVAIESGVAGNGSGNAACFADFDHDGDLDLYLANISKNEFFRNNLDGTFNETSQKMAISGAATPANDLAYGDFDDDGDIDLFVLNSESSNILFSNLRQGQFADVSSGFQVKLDQQPWQQVITIMMV